MRVLLTGGAGFIGTHVRERLHERGHDVRVFDRCAAVSGDPTGDVRDAGAMVAAVRGAEAVVHLAAKVGLGVGVADSPDYASANVHGTAVVLAAMAEVGVRRLVLASSMVVYGGGLATCAVHGDMTPPARTESALQQGLFDAPCPICGRPLAPCLVDEQAPLDPANAYAASKVAQEHFATSWARAAGGSVAALRYHNVYGPGMPRDTPYAGVAAIFRSALLRGERPQVFEDGRQRRDFVHVRDVAAATVAVLEQHETGTTAVNVGSGTPRTVGDVAQAMAAAGGTQQPQVTGAYRLGDVRHITADSSRLHDRYGWSPTVAFDDGMAELMSLTSA